MLLFPRSKKNRFWSALITLETPVSSWPVELVARSTVEEEGWLPWSGINPTPTSSESPTRCSSASEGFCFQEEVRIRPERNRELIS